MIRIVPFEAYHLINATPGRREQTILQSANLLDLAHDLRVHSVAYSALDGDQVVCMAGYGLRWKGVAEAWFFASTAAAGWWWWISKTLRRRLAAEMDRAGLHRLQTVVIAGDDQALRWAEWLGFTVESRLSQYTPDRQDCWLVAMVRP